MTSKKQRGRPKHPDILTPAEWRVVEGVRHGMTNRQIAERRSISIDAVKYHVSNALLKLGFSGRKELQSWDGIAVCSAVSGQKSAGLNTLRIGQISRTVSNIEEARRWYEQKLGLVHLYSFDDLTFFDCGGVRIFLRESADQLPEESIIYFQVSNVHRAKCELEERDVEFINAPHMIHKHENGTEEWMAFFKDNDGRPLGIISQTYSDAENE